MFKRFQTPIGSIAIIGLVLVFALTAAWATINYYSASAVIGQNASGKFVIVHENDREAIVHIQKGALDHYLEDQDIDEVEITVEMSAEEIKTKGKGYYRLEFTFGPSGAYFDPPLELELSGKYANTPQNEIWLYDENGEVIEATVEENTKEIRFYIPHFSSYSYDEYDY